MPTRWQMSAGFIFVIRLFDNRNLFHLFYLIFRFSIKLMQELICLHGGEKACRRAQMRDTFIRLDFVRQRWC